MKTTLNLSKFEAEAIICESRNVDVVVIDVTPVGNFLESLLRITRIQFPQHRSDQKINAIKSLRDANPGMGLAEAKFSVERPEDAINHWLRYGRYLQS